MMVWGIDEEYIHNFLGKFEKDIKKDESILEKLEDYGRRACGDYLITLDSRKGGRKRKKVIKIPEKEETAEDEESEDEKLSKIPKREELGDKFKKIEKFVVGTYLPNTLGEFFELYKGNTTFIETGEKRDAVIGKISIRKRSIEGKIKTEYYLKGQILRILRGALIKKLPLSEALKDYV